MPHFFTRSMLKRLENMKMATVPHTKTTCSLCGHEFGILLKSSTHCDDCGRLICSRCSVEFTEELPEKSKKVSDPSNISPSRYLPPESTAAAGDSKSGSRVLQRLWQSRQMLEGREETNDGSRIQALCDFNGSAGDASKHKPNSLERQQSLSRISNLFILPKSLASGTTLAPTSNHYHLCKLCWEAREVSRVSITKLNRRNIRACTNILRHTR